MTASRAPEAAVVGPHVVATLRAAAALAPLLQRVFREARRDGARIPAYLQDMADACEAAAAFSSSHTGSGTPDVPIVAGGHTDPVESQVMISTAEAARRRGVTERAIRARIDRGTLAAHQVGGRWLINPDDLGSSKGMRSIDA